MNLSQKYDCVPLLSDFQGNRMLIMSPNSITYILKTREELIVRNITSTENQRIYSISCKHPNLDHRGLSNILAKIYMYRKLHTERQVYVNNNNIANEIIHMSTSSKYYQTSNVIHLKY